VDACFAVVSGATISTASPELLQIDSPRGGADVRQGARQSSPVGAGRVRPGTMRALALSYFASPEFRTLRQSTQRARRWIIERFCEAHGDKRAALLQREHDRIAHLPAPSCCSTNLSPSDMSLSLTERTMTAMRYSRSPSTLIS
jgi:hypothetical protein